MNNTNDIIIDIPGDAVPPELVQTKIYVIAGGPCSGKTSLINALRARNYEVAYEPAEVLLKQEIAAGKQAEEVRRNPVQWQGRVVRADLDLFSRIAVDTPTFVDTSLIETYVFAKRAGMDFGHHLKTYLKHFRFSAVFFLEPLTMYQTSKVRMEDQSTAASLSLEIWKAYCQFGYEPYKVPAVSIDKRVEIIVKLVGKNE